MVHHRHTGVEDKHAETLHERWLSFTSLCNRTYKIYNRSANNIHHINFQGNTAKMPNGGWPNYIKIHYLMY